MAEGKRSSGHGVRAAFGIAGLSARLLRRTARMKFPTLELEERLAMLPAAAPLSAPLSLSFNDQHVPFVEAQTWRDGAVGLGIVHAHLRLAQIEVMRHAAHGRISEVVGAAAIETDTLLRLIDFPRAADESLGLMPEKTRAWIDGFADGLNVVADAKPHPPEFEALGIVPQPFTAEDLFAISRLCSADYSWKVWRTLNRLRQADDWAEMWAELTDNAAATDEEIHNLGGSAVERLPTAFSPMGSNAFALAGSRTQSGKPMLSCDPHLMIGTPNPWMVVGLKVPEVTVWGLTIPGLPIFGAGRNGGGAWGGTNLHAMSSDLVDVSEEVLTTQTIRINPHGGRPVHKALRQSSMGPVISDARPFAMPAETVALRWVGHRPSDEFTPFLDGMCASDWAAFGSAVDRTSLPGLNMIWAGNDGTIAKMIAAHLPRRPLGLQRDLIISHDEAKEQWADLATGDELPSEVNPPDGLVVSANDAPKDPKLTISHFFAAPIRSNRIRALMDGNASISAADVRASHGDVYLEPAAVMVARLSPLAQAVRPDSPVTQALAAWDAEFTINSVGALAFVLVATGLIDDLPTRVPAPRASPSWRPLGLLIELIDRADDDDLRDALGPAIDAAEKPMARHKRWGGLHRLRLSHPLQRLPWLRGRLPVIDLPTAGSTETLCKSMHPFTRQPHTTTFGANARFFADLSHPDETYAVLLGGQDGWPGSRTMFDMVGPWRRGDMIRLPVSEEAVKAEFPHVRVIAPLDD